jgi:excinuclease ABC subunit A
MGPAGGHKGGLVVAAGTPEELAETAASHTGAFLRHVLGLTGEPAGSPAALARADQSNGVAPVPRAAAARKIAVKAAPAKKAVKAAPGRKAAVKAARNGSGR